MISAPKAAPTIDPMPPTITTTRLASRKRVSSPGDSDWNVAPMIPAIPASPAPKPNTARNTSWMRTPEAASISRSSTPARISMPSAVRFKTSHIAMPITIAATRIQMRTDG